MKISRTAILRLLIVLAFVAAIAEIAANTLFKNTLPAELVQFVKAQDSTPLTGSALAVGLFVLLLLVSNFVGVIGLWWGKRWARLVFSIGVLLMPVLVTVLGFVDSSTLVLNPVELGLNYASTMLDGAILALIWFGMPEQFERAPQV